MLKYLHNEAVDSYFVISDDFLEFLKKGIKVNNLIHILWNRSDTPNEFTLDGIPVILNPNQITTITYLHYIKNAAPGLSSYSFNREFYCIQDNDQEISCNGILFFGTNEPPIIDLEEDEVEKFENLHQVFLDEFSNRDNIQEEMLRMLLKRLIIKITRLAKNKYVPETLSDSQTDLIRKFNVLVDMHFKEKHQVNDYAELLFKSPKTLSNLFSRYKQKTPLQIIHDRIILEAKRQLLYTDKTAKEIAYEVGFDDDSAFFKFFKKRVNMTPQAFKASYKVA